MTVDWQKKRWLKMAERGEGPMCKDCGHVFHSAIAARRHETAHASLRRMIEDDVLKHAEQMALEAVDKSLL